MMNCSCGMVDWRKVISLISSRDHCPRSSPSRISDTLRAVFEPAFRFSWMELCSSDNYYTTVPCGFESRFDFFFLFTILIKGYFTWFILTKLKLNVHCQGLLILLDFNWRLYWVQVLVKMDQSLWLFVLYCLATSGTKYVIQTCDEHVSIAKQWLAVL